MLVPRRMYVPSAGFETEEMIVRRWYWEEGESELATPQGTVIDFNVLDYPDELEVVMLPACFGRKPKR